MSQTSLTYSAKKESNRANIRNALYDYRDSIEALTADANGTESSTPRHLQKTNNVIAVAEAYKGWDYGSLFMRMKTEQFSLSPTDRDRFDDGAINVGLSNYNSGTSKATYKAKSRIQGDLRQLATITSDIGEKRNILDVYRDVENFKGNNLRVLRDYFSNQDIFNLASNDNLDLDDPKSYLLGSTLKIFDAHLPETSKIEQNEENAWNKYVKFKKTPEQRHPENYHADVQATKIDKLLTSALQILQNGGLDSRYHAGVMSVVDAIQAFTDKPTSDFQSVLDDLEAKAYRTKQPLERTGMLDAIHVSRPYVEDVSLQKTKQRVDLIIDSLESATIQADAKRSIVNDLREFKGNNLSSLGNKFQSMSVFFDRPNGEESYIRGIKQSAATSFIAINDIHKSLSQDAGSVKPSSSQLSP